MLVYFSATGNTKHVVDEIKIDGEKVVSIDEAIKNDLYEYEIDNNRLGILTPTYFWGLPSIVYEFLEKFTLSFDDKPYTFYVGTFGTTTGAASSIANKLLTKKGLSLDGKFDIRMPDTWTVIFNLSNHEKVRDSLANSERELIELKAQLQNHTIGTHMSLTIPEFVGRVTKAIYDSKFRKTKKLSVSDECIGCSICATRCPVQAIEMKEGKPIWVKDACTMCLGCLHRCPQYAIYYGNGKFTNAHGQYTYANAIKSR